MNLPIFFIMYWEIFIYRRAGAKKITPEYFDGFLRVILKAIVPPKLWPTKNNFGVMVLP